MTPPLTRPSPESIAANHEKRIKKLEWANAGPWIYVGSGGLTPDGDPVPPFLNSWDNAGDPLMPLRFRWITDGGIDLQGSITGGATGTVIFELPDRPQYMFPFELRGTASDDGGGLIVIRVLPTREVVAGL